MRSRTAQIDKPAEINVIAMKNGSFANAVDSAAMRQMCITVSSANTTAVRPR